MGISTCVHTSCEEYFSPPGSQLGCYSALDTLTILGATAVRDPTD